MSNKTFNILRFLAEVGLPALAALVGTIGTIWALPLTVPAVATVVALNVFVGALVGIKRNK